jgi:hypothetical protein
VIHHRKNVVAALSALLLSIGTASCGTPPDSASRPGLPTATGEQRLAGVCPDPLVIQSHWEPGAEGGAEFQLVGPGHVIDATRKRISGPLVIDGKDTGITIEIRAGGAAIGFASVPAQLYLDRSITLGHARTDTAISVSGKFPLTAVIAVMNKSPQALMWDPASHPDWRGIADIGRSSTPVVLAKDGNFAPFLVAKGLIKQSQIDLGYTGTPARFLADPTIVQQAYATDEPYIYQHELPAWGRPVAYQLLADVGYTIYPDALSVRSGDLTGLSGCLKRLVPIVQKAQVDYLREPGPANQLIVDTVAHYNDGWTYSLAVANYAVATAKRLRLVGNDTSGPLGGMDPARVQDTINTFAPLLRQAGAAVKPGLAATDIATNEFLDPAIRLP